MDLYISHGSDAEHHRSDSRSITFAGVSSFYIMETSH